MPHSSSEGGDARLFPHFQLPHHPPGRPFMDATSILVPSRQRARYESDASVPGSLPSPSGNTNGSQQHLGLLNSCPTLQLSQDCVDGVQRLLASKGGSCASSSGGITTTLGQELAQDAEERLRLLLETNNEARQKEFAALLQQVREEVTTCLECRSRSHPSDGKDEKEHCDKAADGSRKQARHQCQTHNYMEREHVRPFVQRHRMYHARERLEKYLAHAAESEASPECNDAEAKASDFWMTDKWLGEFGNNPEYISSVKAELTPATQSLASHCVMAPARATGDATSVVMSSLAHQSAPAFQTLAHALKLGDLDNFNKNERIAKGDKVEGEEVASGEEEQQDNQAEVGWDSGADAEFALHTRRAMRIPPKHGEREASHGTGAHRVVQYSLCINKGALMELMMAPVNMPQPEQNAFRLPLVVRLERLKPMTTSTSTVSSVKQRLPTRYCAHIEIGKPLPKETVTRRCCVTNSMKHLVDTDASLSVSTAPAAAQTWQGDASAAPCAAPNARLKRSKCCSEVRLTRTVDATIALGFHVVSNATFDARDGQPVFRMIKVEYVNKGTAHTGPLSPETEGESSMLLRERFSAREAMTLTMLFNCFPSAKVYVYRVHAYAATVVRTEILDRSAWSAMSSEPRSRYLTSDDFPKYAWTYLHDTLVSMIHSVAIRTEAYLAKVKCDSDGAASVEDDRAEAVAEDFPPLHFVFVKLNTHNAVTKDPPYYTRFTRFRLHWVQEVYPGFATTYDSSLEAARCSFVEKSSQAVCEREYLAPVTIIPPKT